MNYCSECGEKVVLKIPEGDLVERSCCSKCGMIHYVNPKVIVGSLIWKEDKILLAKRAIPPRENFWTIPAGFLELKESVENGAQREVVEEVNAEIKIERLFAVISIVHISQVYILYLSRLENENFFPGEESLEAKLFSENEIPWDEIAFDSIKKTIKYYFENRKSIEKCDVLQMTI